MICKSPLGRTATLRVCRCSSPLTTSHLWAAPSYTDEVPVTQLQVLQRKPVRLLGMLRPSTTLQLENRVKELEADVKELKDFNTKLIDGLKDAKAIIDEDSQFWQAKKFILLLGLGAFLLFISLKGL